MNPTSLKSSLASDSPPALVDVRLADDFESARISGAKNACVFEVTFLDQVAAIIADKPRPIVVYGFGGGSHEATMAAEKLAGAGYAGVGVLDGGLDGWIALGGETEGTGTGPDESVSPDGTLPLDLAESRVGWTGRNLLNKHWGTLGIKSGFLEFADGSLTGGQVVIDMHVMDCTDLAGNAMHDVLVDHLKSDDFFDVDRHPETRFVIREVVRIPDAADSEPNIEIAGDLTMRGMTKPLRFQAVAGLTADGVPAAQASFAFDRTEWGVIYGSGKFFRRLAGHLVSDLIELELRVVCAPAEQA